MGVEETQMGLNSKNDLLCAFKTKQTPTTTTTTALRSIFLSLRQQTIEIEK